MSGEDPTYANERMALWHEGHARSLRHDWQRETRAFHLDCAAKLRAANVNHAAIALMNDIRRRHTGEEFKCPYVRALDEAVNKMENA